MRTLDETTLELQARRVAVDKMSSAMAGELTTGEAGFTASTEQAVGPYLRALRRNWRLVALITALATVVAIATVSRISRDYQSSASILVSPLSATNSSVVGLKTVVETGDPARTVQTAAALVDTQEAAAGAARQLGRGWTANRVLAAVTVDPRGASDVIAITAKAKSGAQAAKIANAFAASAISYRASVVQAQIATILASLGDRLTTLKATGSSAEAGAIATTMAELRVLQGPGREPTMSLSQPAQPASSPTGAPNWLIVLLAMVGGFALGSIAALGLETFRRPVRDRDEIESLYPLPILAALPRMKTERRKRNISPWSFTPIGFEQMRLLRVQLSADVISPVIMVTSAGSGDGKTTVAAALAAAFAEVHEKVILMDLDLRKPDLIKALEMDGEAGGNLPRGVPIAVPRLPGVQVVLAPRGDLARFEALIRRLPDLLAHARMSADCVIIDTAPVGEVSDALRIAPICDDVVFVARPRHTDRRRLSLSRELLDRAGAPMAGLVLIGEESHVIGGEYSYEYSKGPHGALEEHLDEGFDLSETYESGFDLEPGDAHTPEDHDQGPEASDGAENGNKASDADDSVSTQNRIPRS